MRENPNFFAGSYQHSPFHPKIKVAEVNYIQQLMTTYLAVYFGTQFEQISPLLALKINLVHNIRTSEHAITFICCKMTFLRHLISLRVLYRIGSGIPGHTLSLSKLGQRFVIAIEWFYCLHCWESADMIYQREAVSFSECIYMGCENTQLVARKIVKNFSSTMIT